MEIEIITKSPSSSTNTDFANLDKEALKRIRKTELQRKYRERERREKAKIVVPPKVIKTNADRQEEYRERRKEARKRKQGVNKQKTRAELEEEYPDPVELAKQLRLRHTEWQRVYRERQKLTRVKVRKTRAELEKEFPDPVELTKHLRRKHAAYQREYRERQKLREKQTPKSRKTQVSFSSTDELTISEESGSGSYPIEYPQSVILTDIKEELIDPEIDEQKVQITVHPVNIKQEFEPPDIQETLTIKTELVIPEIEDIKPIVSIKAELLTPKTEEVMIDDTCHPEFESIFLTNVCDFVPKIQEDKGCQFSTRWEEGFFEPIFVCNRFITDESSHAETQIDAVNIKTPNSYSYSKK